jgi:tetratricopeptide (TPR) repeat protein
MHRFFAIWVVWMIGGWFYPQMATAAKVAHPEASMVIHFKSGEAVPGPGIKAQLKEFLERYEMGPQTRVFIVGYTDAVGDKGRNDRLSRNRARAIRRQIVRTIGLDATVVMAMGRGEASPVADNRSARGRAANRRAEIYLANARLRKPKRIYGPGDPHFNSIQTLVQEAETLIKQRQLGEAVKRLQKAGALGGDHYAKWHTAYGIAGFYANAPQSQIHAHLAAALRLDPYNDSAREYLSRSTARQDVASGAVTPQMGATAENAISVTTIVQEHEYLTLFGATPMDHQKVDGLPVDKWDCLDAQGQPVTYYFDHSKVFGWAFAAAPAAGKSAAAPRHPSKPVPHEAALSVPPPAPARSVSDQPQGVWGSKVFK